MKHQKTGIVTKLHVFQYGKRVGYGYLICHEDLSYNPILFDFNNNPLPTNQWFDLAVTKEQWVCISNDTVQ
jgi:hypothetical protein